MEGLNVAQAVRVIIVEDHRGIAEMLAEQLRRQVDDDGTTYDIIGIAVTSGEAGALIRGQSFELVIMDLELEVKSYPHGFELAYLVHETQPEARIVLWTQYITVEGDLLHRAQRLVGDRALVQAIAPKEGSFATYMRAIQAARDPDVFLWVHRDLRPPKGYSAVTDMTVGEERFIRDFARFGGKPAEVRNRLTIAVSTFNDYRDRVKVKVMRELDARGQPIPLGGRLISDQTLYDWARQRNLHWPMTAVEERLSAADMG